MKVLPTVTETQPALRWTSRCFCLAQQFKQCKGWEGRLPIATETWKKQVKHLIINCLPDLLFATYSEVQIRRLHWSFKLLSKISGNCKKKSISKSKVNFYIKQWFSVEGDCSPRRHLIVWRHFWLSHLGKGVLLAS